MATLKDGKFYGDLQSVKQNGVETNTQGATVPKFVSTFVKGLLTGKGWGLTKGSDSKYTLEIDNIVVRGVMNIMELLISKIRSVKGSIVVSQGYGKIAAVSKSGGNYYITLEDGNDGSIVAGDRIVMAHGYGAARRYYKAIIDKIEDGMLIIAESDLHGTTEPQEGDEIVQMGNENDSNRQGAVYIHADGTSQPAIDVMDNIGKLDNLLIGGDFAELPPAQVDYSQRENGRIYATDQSAVFIGDHEGMAHNGNNYLGVSVSGATSDVYKGVRAMVAVSEGDKVNIGFWCLCANVDGVDRGAYMEVYNIVDNARSNTLTGKTLTFAEESEWQYVSLTLEIPSGCTAIEANIFLGRNGEIILSEPSITIGDAVDADGELMVRIGGDLPDHPKKYGFYCKNGYMIGYNTDGTKSYALNPDGSGMLGNGAISWDNKGGYTDNIKAEISNGLRSAGIVITVDGVKIQGGKIGFCGDDGIEYIKITKDAQGIPRMIFIDPADGQMTYSMSYKGLESHKISGGGATFTEYDSLYNTGLKVSIHPQYVKITDVINGTKNAYYVYSAKYTIDSSTGQVTYDPAEGEQYHLKWFTSNALNDLGLPSDPTKMVKDGYYAKYEVTENGVRKLTIYQYASGTSYRTAEYVITDGLNGTLIATMTEEVDGIFQTFEDSVPVEVSAQKQKQG